MKRKQVENSSPALFPEMSRSSGGHVRGYDKNVLYRGDCLSVLDKIAPDSVDFIYIDPPFFSNRFYELIWEDEGERFAFEDRWRGGIEHYTDWLMERITKLFDVLKPTGSFVVHLDWHAVHYLKVRMDQLPVGKFRDQIIWHYTNKLGTGGNVLDRHTTRFCGTPRAEETNTPSIRCTNP